MRGNLAFTLALMSSMILGAPLAAQQTIEIPRDQIEALPDLPVPQFNFDLSTPEGMIRSIEEISRTDWTGTLPESVFEMVRGMTPIEAHSRMVWEIQASGSWNETLSGTGMLNVIKMEALGASGRQFQSMLDSDARNWPFQVFAFVPDSAPEVTRYSFSGTGSGMGSGGTGVGAITNHMFQRERLVGYATPLGMRTPGFSELEDDYLYTEVDGGFVRIDTRHGTYRLSFGARVVEYHSDGRRPTGNVGSISGWICEEAAYEADPDSCLYDPLELIEVTPESQRENVNYENPQITFTFSDPVDLSSLEDAFTLHTHGPTNARIEVEGEIVQRGDMEYAFIPEDPLFDATRYEARLTGGPDGVVSRDGEEFLEDGRTWRFSTLVNPEGGAMDDDEQITLEAFQTMRDAPLITDKPALLRATPRWNHRDDVHPDWRVNDFPATLEPNIASLRTVAQRGLPVDGEGVLRIRHEDEFTDHDRRMAVDTVNLFGWLPSWSADGMEVTLRILPHDPWPEPLEETMFDGEERFLTWGTQAPTLRLRYVFLEAGSWSDGVPPADRAHAIAALRDAEELSTQLFPVLSSHFTPLRVPGVDGTITREFLFMDFDETEVGAYSRTWRSAVWDLNALFGTNILWESDARAVQAIRRAAERLRWLMNLHREQGDVILLLYPFDIAQIGRATSLGDFFEPHQMDRGIGMAIDTGIEADTLAMGIVHELGHAFGLHHNPGHFSEYGHIHPSTHHDPSIEGFRLALDGSHGWNKSAEDGNAEVQGVLAPLMWPSVTPTSWIWLNESEYIQLMRSFATAPGVRFFGTLLRDASPIQLASAERPDPAMIARLIAGDRPGPEQLAVLGALHPDGLDASIDHVARTHVSHQAPVGDYTAELRNAAGEALFATRFQPVPLPAPHDDGYHNMHSHDATPEIAVHSDAHDPDDPAWWQDFALTLPYHPEATDLIIRRGDNVLAALTMPEAAPVVEPDAEVLDLRTGPAELNWHLHGHRPRVDLQYSPDAETGWDFLLIDQLVTGVRIDPAALPVGPAPTLRLTVRDGLTQTSVTIPVLLERAPEPVLVTATPIAARFDRAVAQGSLEHIALLGPDGAVGYRAALSPDGRQLSIWPDQPLEPDTAYIARLQPGFADRFGNQLSQAFDWEVSAPAPAAQE
ncbi:MAG: Ig-like domain-containing protein [Pararhodobacter sp.]|nr:Ig-like domain-containing protein [Pararhodobacter sp.]